MAQKQKKFNPRAELVSFMERKIDPQLNFNINDILKRSEQRAAALDARGTYRGSYSGSETLVETISDYLHSAGKLRISQLNETQMTRLKNRCTATIGIIESRMRKAPKAQPKPMAARPSKRTSTTTVGFEREIRTTVKPKRTIETAAVTSKKEKAERHPLALQMAMAEEAGIERKKPERKPAAIAAAPKRSKVLPYVYSITIEGNAFSMRVPVKIPNSVESRAAFEKKYGKLKLPAGAGLEQLRAAAVRRLITVGDCIVYNPGEISRKNALEIETVQTWMRTGSRITSVGPKPKATFGG